MVTVPALPVMEAAIALEKVLVPEKVLSSVRRVEEAVLSVAEMTAGVVPRIVKAEHEAAPEQEAVVVAVLYIEVPLPLSMPPSVVEPVPPL